MPSGASVFHKHFVTKLNVKCNITDMHQSHSSVHTNNLAKTLWHYHALVSVAWMTPNGTARHLSVCLSIPVHLSKSAMWWVELVCCLTSHSTIFQLHVYMWRHRCAGELKKKLDLQSGSQCHRHFVGFFNVPVQAPTRGQHSNGYSKKPPHFSRLLRRAWGYGVPILILTPNPPPPPPPGPHGAIWPNLNTMGMIKVIGVDKSVLKLGLTSMIALRV